MIKMKKVISSFGKFNYRFIYDISLVLKYVLFIKISQKRQTIINSESMATVTKNVQKLWSNAQLENGVYSLLNYSEQGLTRRGLSEISILVND